MKNIDRYFYGTTIALILMLCTSLLTADLQQAINLVVCLFMAVLGFTLKGRIPLAANLFPYLIPLLSGLLIIDNLHSVFLLQDILAGALAVSVAFLAIQLYFLKTYRDYWFFILTFYVTETGSLLSGQSISQYLLLLPIFFVFVYNLNAAWIHFSGKNHKSATAYSEIGYYCLVGIAVAAATFVLFPRAQSFFHIRSAAFSGSRSGYAGAVSLDTDNPIEQSEQLALTIRAPTQSEWLSKHAAGLLVRGALLDRFNGKAWERTSLLTNSELSLPLHVAPAAEIVQIEVLREPMGGLDLFYPGHLVSIETNRSKRDNMSLDSQGMLRLQEQVAGRFLYMVNIVNVAQLPTSATSKLLNIPISEAYTALHQTPMRSTLAIPEEIKTAEYFKSWQREVGIDPAKDSVSAATNKILQNFSKHFTYSLQNTFTLSDTFASFIAKDRRGHCEFFATSAALLLRSLGIPTRIAVGFRGGVYNPIVDSLEVRDINAHAWVEIRLANSGWIPFDPTPPGGMDLGAETGSARHFVSALRYFANRYILYYDWNTQKKIVQDLRAQLKSPTNEPLNLRMLLSGRILLQLSLLLGLLIVAFLVWRYHQKKRPQLPKDVKKFYKMLARRGYAKEPAETYRQFHQRISVHLPELEASRLWKIDTMLHQALYAAGIPTRQKTAKPNIPLKQFD